MTTRERFEVTYDEVAAMYGLHPWHVWDNESDFWDERPVRSFRTRGEAWDYVYAREQVAS